jgi:hypothetical protein
MKIHLLRTLETREYYVLMEIYRASRKRDLIAYAKLAREQNNVLTPALLNKKLLNRSENVAIAVLDSLVRYGLFAWDEKKREARLTREGEYAAANDVAYLYEHDVYRVVCSPDPLLPQPVIVCERAPWKRSEIRKVHEKEESSPATTPPEILSCKGKELEFFRPSRTENESIERDQIRIDRVFETCWPISSRAEYILAGTIGDDGWFRGEVRGERPIASWKNDAVTLDSTLRAIASQVREVVLLDGKDPCIEVVFSDVEKDINRREFKGDRRLGDLVLGGAFGPWPLAVTLYDVPMMPKNSQEADRWYLWLLEDGLSGYLSSEAFEGYAEGVRMQFQTFGADRLPQIKIGAHELAGRIEERNREAGRESRPERYWYLPAPCDLRYGGSQS